MIDHSSLPPCYQVIIQVYNQPVSIFTFKTHLEVNSFLEENNFSSFSGPNPIVQYVEHLSYPVPQMEMPPRPQDMEPLPLAMPDSPSDAQKLQGYLDGEISS